jgi:DNA (cytosine-5)-methyltransferase 1
MGEGRYGCISLFSGAMGLDIGLERSGRIRTLMAVELNSAACATIRANRDAGRIGCPGMRIHEGDVRALSPEHCLKSLSLGPGGLDLLVGGPPCQAFSSAGRRGSVTDPRGGMAWQFIRFLEAAQPKAFLIENVRGILSAPLVRGGDPDDPDAQPGSVIRQLAKDLMAVAGGPYRLDILVCNVLNHGAPQSRERILIIGNRLGRTAPMPSVTHGPEAGQSPYRTLGHALRGLEDPEPEVLDFSPRKKRFLALVPPGGNWRSLPEPLQRESMGAAFAATGGRSGWWRRLSHDLPCPTLLTIPNHSSTAMCHPDATRALSLAECAAVQGFPRDWEFKGKLAERYAQVGNAVPVRLGELAGEILLAILDGTAPLVDPGEAPGTVRVTQVGPYARTHTWGGSRRGKAKAS